MKIRMKGDDAAGGTVALGLYGKVVPKTVENFRCFLRVPLVGRQPAVGGWLVGPGGGRKAGLAYPGCPPPPRQKK